MLNPSPYFLQYNICVIKNAFKTISKIPFFNNNNLIFFTAKEHYKLGNCL